MEATDETGEVGFLDLAEKMPNAADENMYAVRLGSGELIFVEANRLKTVAVDKFRYEGKFGDVPHRFSLNSAGSNQADFNQSNSAASETGEITVPLIAEEISISRKIVNTGGVRVHKTVREDVQTINEPIVREHLDVERVAVNQFVETAPAVRYEGDVMIVPVLEEVVVTQKRLLLREEIRLTKSREQIANAQEITLRREEISLENIGTDETVPETPER